MRNYTTYITLIAAVLLTACTTELGRKAAEARPGRRADRDGHEHHLDRRPGIPGLRARQAPDALFLTGRRGHRIWHPFYPYRDPVLYCNLL